MRVTNKIIADTLKSSIQSNIQKLARTQQEISTGKRIHHPGDDPAMISRLMNLKGTLEGNIQYAQNIDDGLSFLEAADAALETMADVFRQAHEYAVQGANGTLGTEDMQQIGQQIDKMIDNVVDLANASIGGKYIFAGKGAENPLERPFQRTGDRIVYKGGTEDVEREILFGASYKVAGPGVAASGEDSYFGKFSVDDDHNENVVVDWNNGSKPENIFVPLFELRDALNKGNQEALSDIIGDLQQAHDRVLQERVKVGARTRHFEGVKQQLLNQELLVKQAIVNIDGIDIEKTSIDLAQQQLNYMAALSAGANILQTSLLNFLK